MLTVSEAIRGDWPAGERIAVSGYLAISQRDFNDEGTAECWFVSREDVDSSNDPKSIAFNRKNAIEIVEPGLASAVIQAGYTCGGWALDVFEVATICGCVSREVDDYAIRMDRLSSVRVRDKDFTDLVRVYASNASLPRRRAWQMWWKRE